MTGLTIHTLDGSEATLGANALETLRNSLGGQVITQGEPGYDEARSIFNGVHDQRPALFVRCAGASDVIEAVNFARENRLLLSIRGGGHNVAGTCLCDRGMVIDLSAMKGIRVDPDSRLADVQGGVTWGELDRETQRFGLVAPGGVVSTTGVAGLTLGGGLGWVRRKYGMSIDSLVAVDIVTADGTFRTVSADREPDLFWAVRGGGGNFGVVTSFRFRLHPLAPVVLLAAPIYPVEKAEALLAKWRDFCADAPDEASCFAIFQTIPADSPFPREVWGREVLAMPAAYAGPVEDGQRVLQPLREFDTPLLDLTQPIPFVALQQMFNWLLPWGGQFYWKTTTLRSLDADTIAAVTSIGTSRSSPDTVSGLWQLGGAMARVPADATAYGRRDAPFLFNIDSAWQDPAEQQRHVAWTRAAWARLQPFSDGGMYLHYNSLEDQDRIQASYGDNFGRLVQVKNRYDPMNLFRRNQNIRPSVAVPPTSPSAGVPLPNA